MQHRQAQERSGAGRAEREPERAGKPAATGSGTAGVESQLVELQTRVGGLETVSERAEDRWEKSRTDQEETKREIVVIKQDQAAMKKELAELRKEQTELRKEQTELRKEMGVGFRRVDEKMDAGFRQVGEKFDAMGREIAAISRRVDEKLEEARKATEELAQQFIRRVEFIALLILAAILGTGIFG